LFPLITCINFHSKETKFATSLIRLKPILMKEVKMKRKGYAEWKGGIIEGRGSVSTESGVLSNTQYSFSSRFEQGIGTNPEELIAAAHAGCFSMAFAGQLEAAKLIPESINTTATVIIEKLSEGFTITAVHLDVRARVPGASVEAFNMAAKKAKEGCPVSKVLNARITMDAVLES
jgi:osmotically inducible protein OsmC